MYQVDPIIRTAVRRKIRESTAGVSRKPSSDGKARGCSSKHLCGSLIGTPDPVTDSPGLDGAALGCRRPDKPQSPFWPQSHFGTAFRYTSSYLMLAPQPFHNQQRETKSESCSPDSQSGLCSRGPPTYCSGFSGLGSITETFVALNLSCCDCDTALKS